MPNSPPHLEHGINAELIAARYLEQRGLKLLTQNYRCPFGEIDLVMRDKDVLVFVEVRLRRNTSFGGAAFSITEAKRARISRTAEHYLQRHGNVACRFDVILMREVEANTVEWLVNAF